jgi:phosphoglucosamine mutase
LITALQVLAVMQRTGRSLSELAVGMDQFPQVLLNVKVREPVDPTRDAAVRNAVDSVEAELGGRGRVVLRASGTEPVIRIMVEGEDRHQVSALAGRLADSVRSSFGLER